MSVNYRLPCRNNVILSCVFILANLLAFACTASAQGYRVDGVTQARSGFPAAAVTIAVCAEPATVTTTPCSTLATLYTDSTLTTPCSGVLQSPPATSGGAASSCSNPLIADGLGNYHYYVASGRYALQFYGSGITTYAQRDQIYPCDQTKVCSATLTNNVNNILYACSTSTAFLYQTIAQANTALPSSGGVIQTCPGHTETSSAFNLSKANTSLILAAHTTLTAAAVFPSWSITADSVTVRGEGASSAFQGPSSGSGIIFQVGSPGLEVSGAQLDNFLLDCGDTSSPLGQRSGFVLYVSKSPSSSDLSLQNCNFPFQMFGDGVNNTAFKIVRLSSTNSYQSAINLSTNVTDGLLDSPHIVNTNTGADGAGVFLLNAAGGGGVIRIANPYVNTSGNNGIRVQRNNVVITNPQIIASGNLENGVASTGDGLRLEANNITVIGGTVTGGGTGNGGDGIKSEDSATTPTVKNITVIGTQLFSNKNHGFDVTTVGGNISYVSAVGVQSFSNAGNGYRFNGGTNISVVGGSAVGNSQWGVNNTQTNVSVCNVDWQSTANTSGTITTAPALTPCPFNGGAVSGTVNPATTGTINLSSPDSICFRNPANSADNCLIEDASGALTFAGVPLSGAFTKVNVTPVTSNTNTTADQNLMAVTITAGALNSLSRTLLVQLAGVYSTPAASTAVLTHKLKLCTVSGCGSGTVLTLATWTTAALGAIQVTNDPYNATLNASTQTAGASAAFEAHGNLTIDLSALTTAAEVVYADNNTATVGTINATAQLFLQHSIAFNAASASNSATDRQMIADTVD